MEDEQPQANKQEPHRNHPIIKAIAIVLFIVGAFFLVGFITTRCNLNTPTNTPQLFTRSATNNDITFDLSQEFSFNINYEITPKVDVSGLQITFQYLDSNGNILTTKIKDVGNVKKSTTYTISVSLTEFSLSQIFKIESVSARVTGGSVSYFA